MDHLGRDERIRLDQSMTVARTIRLAAIVIAVSTALTSCGGGPVGRSARPKNSSVPTSTTSPPTTTTSMVPSTIPACTASQLNGQYRGSQGAAGNLVSSFWIANSAASPCALRSSVTVELLDSAGHTRTMSHAIDSPILLSAMGIIPPLGQNPAQGQMLASLIIGWPTVPNAVEALGGTGVQCPQPLLQAHMARITFDDAEPLIVENLTNSGPPPSGSIPPICGSDVYVWEISSLTAPEPP